MKNIIKNNKKVIQFIIIGFIIYGLFYIIVHDEGFASWCKTMREVKSFAETMIENGVLWEFSEMIGHSEEAIEGMFIIGSLFITPIIIWFLIIWLIVRIYRKRKLEEKKYFEAAKLREAEKQRLQQAELDLKKQKYKRVRCEFCGTLNKITNDLCKSCGGVLTNKENFTHANSIETLNTEE